MTWRKIVQASIQRISHEEDPNHKNHVHATEASPELRRDLDLQDTGVCRGCDQVKSNLTAANFKYYDPVLQTWDLTWPDYYCTDCFEKHKGDILGPQPEAESEWDDYLSPEDFDGTPDWQDPDWSR